MYCKCAPSLFQYLSFSSNKKRETKIKKINSLRGKERKGKERREEDHQEADETLDDMSICRGEEEEEEEEEKLASEREREEIHYSPA